MSAETRLDTLSRMLKNEPDDVFLNYALALEYLKAGKTSDAENQFLKVLNFQPDYVPAYYQLGKLYEEAGDTDKALLQYRAGLELAKSKKNNKAINEFGEAIFMLED